MGAGRHGQHQRAARVRPCRGYRSFTATGQQLGISASAVSKAIVRLEERLGVRLFHRSTRTINPTPEGALFLERCRRILHEMEAAEDELLQTRSEPRGKLRISLPSVGTLFMPKLGSSSAAIRASNWTSITRTGWST